MSIENIINAVMEVPTVYLDENGTKVYCTVMYTSDKASLFYDGMKMSKLSDQLKYLIFLKDKINFNGIEESIVIGFISRPLNVKGFSLKSDETALSAEDLSLVKEYINLKGELEQVWIKKDFAPYIKVKPPTYIKPFRQKGNINKKTNKGRNKWDY